MIYRSRFYALYLILFALVVGVLIPLVGCLWGWGR
jgi:hypothetical protein